MERRIQCRFSFNFFYVQCSFRYFWFMLLFILVWFPNSIRDRFRSFSNRLCWCGNVQTLVISGLLPKFDLQACRFDFYSFISFAFVLIFVWFRILDALQIFTIVFMFFSFLCLLKHHHHIRHTDSEFVNFLFSASFVCDMYYKLRCSF